jgi:hypothetical protein
MRELPSVDVTSEALVCPRTHASFAELVTHPDLAPGRLIDRKLDDSLLDLGVNPFLENRFLLQDVGQRSFTAVS